VVSLYHLAIPSVTLFSAHQVGILFASFNATISSAVRSLPAYGKRVAVIAPPRFFHPDRQGYAQFAATLVGLVRQKGWGPG